MLSLVKVVLFVILFFSNIVFAYQPNYTISNFPAIYPVSGTVQIGNFPAGFNVLNFPITQGVSGTVSVGNFPATQAVTQSGAPWSISAASLPLPTGAATSANQATANASLSSIDSKLSGTLSVSTGLSQPLTDAQLRASPLAVSGTQISNIDSATSSINSKLPSGLTVSGTRLLVELPPGGSGLTDAELRASPVPVSGTFSISTAGLATDSNQTTQISKLTSIDSSAASINSKLPSGLTVSGTRLQVELPAGASGLTDAELRASPVPVSATGTVSVSNFPATQPISAASLPLPSGAATAANQSTTNSRLTSIDSTLTSSNGFLNSIESSAASLASAVGLTGAALPTNNVIAAGSDGTNARNLKTNASGELQVGVVGSITANLGTIAGVATETTLSSINTKTPALGQTTMANSSPVVIASNQSSVPISGTITANAGTNLNTSALALESGGNLATIASRTPALGQATMTNSQPVAIASNQSAIPVSQSGAWSVSTSGTTTVSGTVQLTAGSASIGSISNSSFGISGTLPAFAATPTFNVGTIGGIATESTLSALNTKIPASPAQDRTAAASPSSVRLTDGSAFYKATTPSDTQPISAASLPLPSGAATSALQTTGNSSLSSIDGKLPGTLGQKTSANSMAVVIASDQSAIPITGSITASNPSVSGTGVAVPAQATYVGANNGGNLVGLTSTSSGGSKKPLDVAIYDGSGNQITSFGGGTQYANGDAQATPTGTVSLGFDGANVRALLTDSSGRALVNLADTTVSGTITAANANQASGVPTANSVIETPDLAGYSTAVVQITGTYSATLNFYATVDNTNWVQIQSNQIIGSTGNGGNTFSAGISKLNVAGFRRIRVNCSAFVSGAAVVTVRLSPAQFTQTATTAASVNIQQVNGSNVTSVPVIMNGTQSATVTSVAASASSVQLLALNSNRRAAVFYNDSTSAVYIKYGTTASTSSFTYKVLAGQTHEMVNHPYQGRIDAIWDSATGNMRITEW